MKQKIDSLIGKLLVVLMAVMVLDVIWGVFTRYLIGTQASWTEELARFLCIWIGVLGAAYAAGQKMHLAIDLLPQYLNVAQQVLLQYAIQGLVICFAIVVFVIGGTNLIYITISLGQKSASLGIPMGWVYLVLPLSGILIIWYKMLEIISINRAQSL